MDKKLYLYSCQEADEELLTIQVLGTLGWKWASGQDCEQVKGKQAHRRASLLKICILASYTIIKKNLKTKNTDVDRCYLINSFNLLI